MIILLWQKMSLGFVLYSVLLDFKEVLKIVQQQQKNYFNEIYENACKLFFIYCHKCLRCFKN